MLPGISLVPELVTSKVSSISLGQFVRLIGFTLVEDNSTLASPASNAGEPSERILVDCVKKPFRASLKEGFN